MNDDELDRMCNLVAKIFRIEKSASVTASIPPLLSFFKWTTKAGAQQDSLKRAFIVWYKRAQKSAKIIGEDDAIDEMSPEEMEPMFSERIEKWTEELRAEGRIEGKAEGEAKGRAEGRASVFIALFERKFGPMSDDMRQLAVSASSDTIVLLIERLLSAQTPSDVFPPD